MPLLFADLVLHIFAKTILKVQDIKQPTYASGGPDLLCRPMRLLLHGRRPRAAATQPSEGGQWGVEPPLLLLGGSEPQRGGSLAPRWGKPQFAPGAKLL